MAFEVDVRGIVKELNYTTRFVSNAMDDLEEMVSILDRVRDEAERFGDSISYARMIIEDSGGTLSADDYDVVTEETKESLKSCLHEMKRAGVTQVGERVDRIVKGLEEERGNYNVFMFSGIEER